MENRKQRLASRLNRSLRPLVPRTGLPYRVFNVSVGTTLTALCVYILGTPSAGTQTVVSWFPLSYEFWGWTLFVSGIIGTALSYCPNQARRGLMLIGGVLVMWVATLFLGWVFNPRASALGSAILWGMVANHVWWVAKMTHEGSVRR